MVRSSSFVFEEVKGYKFGYHPFGRPFMFVHIYYVDGLLIDTGQRKAQRKILEVTDVLNINQLFITHHHEDHTGNIEAMRKRYDLPVYASPRCCEIMKNPPKLSLAQKLSWGNRPAQHNLLPKTGALTTPNFNFQIIPIPGHATDMVALYEPERQWLFSADLYINSYIDYFLEGESMAQQIASMKKILELDFKVMFCSHKPQLSSAKKQLSKKLDFFEKFFEQVAVLHSKGYTATQIFNQMKLKENHLVKLLSGGTLSKLNMVKSVIADLESGAFMA